MALSEEDVKQLLQRYKEKIETELGSQKLGSEGPIQSRQYQEFKKELLPAHMTFYEKACNFAERIVQTKVKPEKEASLKESIEIAHLNITPTGATSLALVAPAIFVLIGLIFFALIPIIIGDGPNMFFVIIFLLGGLAMAFPLASMPEMLANNWRLKASNQMVLCIFYVVTHMRHTSNLELAVDFAGEHIAPPLALDMKKILWNVETGKYESIKESLDAYLNSWKKWNMEFVESFNLIVSSLYETSEERRINALDKALNVILEETYEKMLHYAQNLKNPITMLHMMGIILPILGLVILPLVVNFLGGVKWYHIAMIYNVVLPVVVYLFGIQILSTRPTGYGDADISDIDPELKKYKNVIVKIGSKEYYFKPAIVALGVFIILFFIGILPLILGLLVPQNLLLQEKPIISDKSGQYFLGYKLSNELPTESTQTKLAGPYGIGASILSLFVTLAFGIAFGIYYRSKSKNLIKIRENAKKLEGEFASSLFQLGNRLGDNIPAEIAFEKVAQVMEGTTSGDFFKVVTMNIRKLGMGLQRAIFDQKIGALLYFPSSLIESSMKVLVESVKKGPMIASQALISVSQYIKEMHRIDERLKDLLSDIISSMKSQISFMTPAISGIVVGITSMITFILINLGKQITELGEQAAAAGGSGVPAIAGFFGNTDPIPTYFFQIIVGIYVVQIVYILTVLSNGIENGADKLMEDYLFGQNLVKSTILYSILVVIVMLIFNILAGTILTASVAGL